MKKYRKKPIVVEAERFYPSDYEKFDCITRKTENCLGFPMAVFYVNTLEGEIPIKLGEWLIKGIEGEYYPCKDSIFKATYEEVNEKI
jgi:hypothetical protein